MTNPFLLSSIEDQQAQPPANANPFALQAIQNDQRQDLRNTLTGAVRQQPEHVAEAARLAKRYPAPVDVLARNLQDVKLQEAVDKYDETLKTSPKLAQYLLDKPWETSRLHKDIEPLAKVEQGFTAGIKSGWTQADNQAEMADLLYKELTGFQLSEPQARRLAALKSENRVLARQQENESNLGFLGRTNAYGIRQFVSSAWTALQGAGYGAAAGAAAGAPLAGVGAVPGAVAGATAGGFTASNAYAYKQEAAFAFDEFRDLRDTSGQPIPVDIARNAAMGVGVVNAVIESTAGLALLKLVPGADRIIGTLGGDAAKALVRTQVRSVLANPVTRSAMVQALGKVAAGASIEGIEEFFQTLVGAGGREVAQSLSGQDFKPDEIRDDLAEALTAAKEAAVGTLALGSVVGGANYVSLRRRAQREAEYDRAVASSENIRTQLQAVQDIQSKAHSPEVFREVVQTMADQQEGATKSLWVDGEVLAQLPAEELATLPAEVQSQIADAAALSGFVEIPIGQVMLAEQGSVLEQTYVEFARETPTSPTLAEAQEAKALLESDLVKEAESAIAQAQEQDTIRASSEVVRKTILEQLNTAGAYRSSVNDALARVTTALFVTQAQRMNMTPEQVFTASGFAVRARGQASGGRVLNADPATPEFREWFGESKVVDTEGAPLVLYRGMAGETIPEEGVTEMRPTTGLLGTGIYMTGFPGRAAGYTRGERGQTYPLYASVQNPISEDDFVERFGRTRRTPEENQAITDQLISEGYDGIIAERGPGQAWEVVAFRPEQVKSVFNERPTQAPGMLEQAAVAEETEQDKANSLSEMRVSPRLPTAKKATEDALGETRLQPDLETAKRDPAVFEHNINLMVQYPNFQGLEGTAEEKAEAIIQHAVDNLLWLHDHWAPEYRDRSKMWYVGGNRIAHRWAERFDVTPEQVAAVIAATSPQKDWFQNVSLAERILEAVINNSQAPWDSKMSDLARTRDWGKKEVPDPTVFEGKTLRDLYESGTPGNLLDMSIWIRAWGEANNPMKARVITPEGGFTDRFDAGKSGKEIGLRWQSFPTIAKTLQVLMTNDRATLSQIIGANHKVRSFYNNIIAPYAGEDVTIDTHAVAAALLRPLGSSSTEVYHNFGSGEPGSVGPKNSAITGLYGTYAIYAEAYRRAAQERGILPREMQSITWEAVRGLFRPEQKNEKIRKESDRIWSAAASGEINGQDARTQIEKLVGGIVDPAWVRSIAGANEAAVDSSYAGELPQAGVSRGGAQPVAGGARGDAAARDQGPAADVLEQGQQQGPRGTYNPRNFEIVLNENANLSTYFHELSHFYLDFLGRMAEMPGASPEVVEDFNTFLKWAKVTPEQWRGWRDFVIANPNKPLPKGMVKVHESLASAGEQYFLEGKAPSLELQPFMRRFARWMESVYRSLQQFIAGNPNKDLQLNADIRRFFDRALATDEEIAQAEQAAGMLPDDDATAEAKERLNKRSMGDLKWVVRMRDNIISDLRKQAKEIEDSIRQTVTEEVDAMPAMQAKDALDRLMAASSEYKAELKAWKDAREAELARATEAVKAQLVAAEEAKTNTPLEGLAKGRFLAKSRAEVENKAEAAALEWEKQNPKPRRITPDMTPQMESIADKYGYTSVDQMLADIDATGSRRELIDGMTEQRMLEDHGDLVDDRAIQQAANEAVHNDARARSLATELRTQQEMLGERADTGRTARNGRKITTNILLAAARNFAANVVGRAKILDLGNLAWKHNSAEARAGKRWQQLTSQGKTVEAVKAKQDQVLNNAAAKAAQEAQAEMRKLLDYVNKFDKESVRAKLPASYLDQIDKLRERVDLRVSTTRRDIDKRAALSKWIESQHALGLDPIVPDYLLDDAQLTSYKEMTVDQFREFADTIKNIEHLGRLKSKLLAAKDKREFDIIVAEIVQEIVANKGTPLPVQLEPDGRIKKFFKGAWADHRKLNSLVRQMDGGKDNGPLYRALVRSMNEAGTKENVMLEQATEAMAKIYAPIEKLPGGFSGASVYIPEINASLSRAGRLAIALNWGNSTNRQRVMGGDNWTEAQVEAILATLSTTELEFVNNVWAQLDSYWPEMKAKQERVSGVVEDKVEAEPFELTAADGTIVQMRGGYYPIKYDSDRSLKSQKNEAQEVAADMLRGAILRPSTRRGHLKARVDEVNRPVRKDLSVITQHVNQVVHDLAWHEWLIDATRLLNDPRIAGSIRDYYGAETHRAMTDSMRAIAEGDIAHQTEIDKLLLLMRSNVTRSIMGASLTTALLQPFGLTQSMARIGVVPVLKGAWRWAGEGAQMQNSMKWIGEKSDFMRLRSKTFNRELREISQRVQGKSKFMQVADASLFFLMQKLQMVADVPTWIGAYEKALAGGVDDATAVQLADEAVLGSQGGGNTKDLAGVQRNLPFLTQFYSYFSTTLQLVAEKTALTDFKNPRAVAGWLGDMALLAVIPAILPALITYLLKGGGEDDEPEDWAKRLAEWQASYVLGMFVGLRELPAVWSPFDYQGPPAGKLINDGKRLVQQAGQGEIDDQAVLATIGFLGTALGIPTTQLVRSYKGWLAWDEGDAPPSSILFGPPPKD